uniref:C-type lectin domain-containing protein n=1 Tax=Xiphophorus maculatus TaxID=8083 RepID=A0A3B5QZH4_XIPMA
MLPTTWRETTHRGTYGYLLYNVRNFTANINIFSCAPDHFNCSTKLKCFSPILLHVFFPVEGFDFVRKVGQKYFVSNKERGSFQKAADFCQQRGLELALPQSEEENHMLLQLMGQDEKRAWININMRKAGGNFLSDMKNRPLTFTKWGESQPDESIQDSGCSMAAEDGTWRVTADCSLDADIICQL